MVQLNIGDDKMSSRELGVGRNFLVRAEHDSDLIKSVAELAKKNGIVTATFTAIGALKYAKLGFYDQKNIEYFGMLLRPAGNRQLHRQHFHKGLWPRSCARSLNRPKRQHKRWTPV
jgi:hypothetical protein